MELFIKNHKSQKKVLEAAIKIQDVLWAKIKQRKQSRELREKLKTLPYVVRASFVKMHMLKAKTTALSTNATLKLGVANSLHP
jgi:hypothetical protein